MRSIRKITVRHLIINSVTGRSRVSLVLRGVYLSKGQPVFLWKGKLVAADPERLVFNMVTRIEPKNGFERMLADLTAYAAAAAGSDTSVVGLTTASNVYTHEMIMTSTAGEYASWSNNVWRTWWSTNRPAEADPDA